MLKISEKDKRIWNFYTSNLNSIKKADINIKHNTRSILATTKVLKSNTYFELNRKTKKQLNDKKLNVDAIVDLHGKTEVQAYEIVKSLIKQSYINERRSIIIITGKGINSQGKLKLKTPIWLKSKELSKFVVGFQFMPHNRGGEGALFVKLRNKNKYIYK